MVPCVGQDRLQCLFDRLLCMESSQGVVQCRVIRKFAECLLVALRGHEEGLGQGALSHIIVLAVTTGRRCSGKRHPGSCRAGR